MASFKDLSDTKALKHLHADTIVVLVEGGSDVEFLERMFPGMKAEIRFEAVGGCTVMKERLQDERKLNPKVIGLLDRDALMREKRWDELFETDNDIFQAATAIWIEGLYVLTRWEIENYLLDLAAVSRLFSCFKVTAAPDENSLLDMMIESALGELHVTAGWCTAHENEIPQHSGPDSCADTHALETLVRKWLASYLPQYDNHLEKVKAFDLGEAAEKRERLAALLRMVDGKRFILRLQRRWMGINKDPSLQLADNVGQLSSRSDDLFHLMDTLRKSA